MNFGPARIPGRTPGPALAGVLADQFLLLRIDADYRLARGEGSGDPVVDVAELGVAIRVLLALDGLGVGLQAVPQRSGQQPPDAVVGDPVPLASQFPGQIAGRLGSPPQPGHRIAPGLRPGQRVQRIQQRWIGLRERHPPPAGPARTPRHRVRARLQLLHPGGHRYPRHPGRLGHQRDPAITQRPGLSRQQQTALPLVQMRQDHLELRCQHPLINLHDHGHTRSMAGQSGHVKVNLRQALSLSFNLISIHIRPNAEYSLICPGNV